MKKIYDLIKQLGDHKIGDSSTLKEPESFSQSGKIEEDLGGGFKVNLGVEGEGSISLINSAEETEQQNDPEGIFFSPKYSDKTLIELLDPHPVVELPTPLQNGYLRYSLGAKFSGLISGVIQPIGLQLEAGIGWQASYYSKHPFVKDNGEHTTIADAILDDLGYDGEDESATPADNIRTLFRSGDLNSRKIKVGDILTFAAAGNLGGSITINASDLLTGSIAYSGLFNKVIPVDYSAGISATLATKFEGDFVTAVAITSDDKLEIVVRRSSAKLSNAKVNFGAKAELDFSAATEVIDSYLSSLSNSSEAAVNKLKKKVDDLLNSALAEADFEKFFTELTSNEKGMLNKWYDELLSKAKDELKDFIDDQTDKILEPLQKLDKLLKNWSEKLAEYTSVSLSLSLSYEMSKLDASADLLRFECDRTAFPSYRKDLLLYRFDSIIKAAEDPNNKKVKILRFLNAKKIEKKTGSSFVVKVGEWAFGGSKEMEKTWIELIDRKDVNKPYVKQASFLGSRTFSSLLFKDKLNYGFTLEGKFKRDAEEYGRTPELKELDYTLAAYSVFSENKLSEADFRQFLDYGFVNGTLLVPRGADLSGQISPKDLGIKLGKKTEITQGISVTGDAAKSVLIELSLLTDSQVANALAVAMYPWSGYAGRNNLQERLNAYHKAWLNVIKNNADSDWSTKNALNASLDTFGYKKLATFETSHWRHQNGHSAYKRSLRGILESRGGRSYSSLVHSFLEGFDELQDRISSIEYNNYSELEDIFNQVSKAWDNDFSSRWFTALLNTAIRNAFGDEIPKKQIEYKYIIKQGNTVIPLTAQALTGR